MSLYKKVGVASLIMMASVFLSRVIGLFREMVIAYAGGVKAEVDAYQIAFVIPEIFNHIAATGFLSITFIPIFSRYLVENHESEGWKVFSIILNVFGLLLLIGIAVGWVLAPELTGLAAPGLTNPEIKALAIRMTRIILPAQFFFFCGGLFTSVQFAKEQFAVPALAPLIYNLGIIAGGVLLSPMIGMEGFAWGVLAGAFIGNFVLQFNGALNAGMKYSLSIHLRHPDVKKYVLLTLPLMFGMTMTFSTEFFLKFFGSYLPAGGIASLNYGLRVMFILVGFFGQAVGVASFPFMARLAAEKNFSEINRLLNHALRYLSLVIPLSVLFMVLRHEIIRMLFQRGRFDAAATAQTGDVLIYLMIGAFAFSAQTVVVRGWYAMQNTLFPTIFSTLSVGLSLPAYYYGLKLMGINGVALSVSFSAILQVALLYALWNRWTQNTDSRAVYSFFLRITLISVLIGLGLEGFRHTWLTNFHTENFLESLIVSLIVAVIFAVLLFSVSYLFKIKEVSDLVKRISSRKRSDNP